MIVINLHSGSLVNVLFRIAFGLECKTPFVLLKATQSLNNDNYKYITLIQTMSNPSPHMFCLANI